MSKTGQYYEGIGRRKTAVARVRLTPDGKNLFLVNDRPLAKYFPAEEMQWLIRQPLAAAALEKPSISVHLSGSGARAQAGALVHGLARALLAYSAELRPLLKRSKYLTRDARMKERRKFGLKKARKAPQWSKR